MIHRQNKGERDSWHFLKQIEKYCASGGPVAFSLISHWDQEGGVLVQSLGECDTWVAKACGQVVISDSINFTLLNNRFFISDRLNIAF